MSVILWDTSLENPIRNRWEHHTEFVVGLDFNIFIEGQMASCCKS
jgi:peroxin-7